MKKNLAVVVLSLLVGAAAGQVVRDLHLIRSPYEVGGIPPRGIREQAPEPVAPRLRGMLTGNTASPSIGPTASGRGLGASPEESAPDVRERERPRETLHDAHLRSLMDSGALRRHGSWSSEGYVPPAHPAGDANVAVERGGE